MLLAQALIEFMILFKKKIRAMSETANIQLTLAKQLWVNEMDIHFDLLAVFYLFIVFSKAFFFLHLRSTLNIYLYLVWSICARMAFCANIYLKRSSSGWSQELSKYPIESKMSSSLRLRRLTMVFVNLSRVNLIYLVHQKTSQARMMPWFPSFRGEVKHLLPSLFL